MIDTAPSHPLILEHAARALLTALFVSGRFPSTEELEPLAAEFGLQPEVSRLLADMRQETLTVSHGQDARKLLEVLAVSGERISYREMRELWASLGAMFLEELSRNIFTAPETLKRDDTRGKIIERVKGSWRVRLNGAGG